MMSMIELWNLNKKKINSGKLAEFICRIYMRFHGYKIIAKNYRCGSGKNTPCGELDFIALKKHTLIFCEVKKRQKDSDFLFALSPKQQKRIFNGAQYFIKHHKKFVSYSMRFDVFFVKLPFHIQHIKNALRKDYDF